MKHLFILIIITLMISCQSGNNSETSKVSPIEKEENVDLPQKSFDPVFPELLNLNSLHSSIFIPTLENSFNSDLNAIYAATLCIAWKEIQDTIGSAIKNCESEDLTLMSNSKSYLNVLNKNEYLTSIKVTKDSVTNLRLIEALAYFKKSLPFDYPLSKYDNELAFNDVNIISFGFNHKGPAKILYYNDGDDFAIKLYPKDSEHEIILIKTDFTQTLSIQNEIKSLEKQIENFRENRSSKNIWKYKFNEDDRVRIPVIKFHLEHVFEDIVGSHFYTEKNIPFRVTKFYQKNAFILDENGAIVESLAIEEVIELFVEEEPQAPKNLLFDKPFIILLKRENSKFPYFAIYIGNNELMKKSNL